MNWFTKRKVLLYSILYIILFLFTYIFGKSNYCSLNCYRSFELLIIYSLISIPFFVFSIITYKLKESTFILWRNFTVWAIPISLVIISFVPTNTHGMDFLLLVKGTVILALTTLYTIISLILIIYKSFKKEKI